MALGSTLRTYSESDITAGEVAPLQEQYRPDAGLSNEAEYAATLGPAMVEDANNAVREGGIETTGTGYLNGDTFKGVGEYSVQGNEPPRVPEKEETKEKPEKEFDLGNAVRSAMMEALDGLSGR